MTTHPPITSLFHWDSVPNFGDAIGPEIVERLLGRTLPKAQGGQSGVLMSCGSIIHYAPRFESVVVWGSGLEPHYGAPPADGVTYLAVRGPKTAEAVGYTGGVYGDPAILAPRLHPRRVEPVSGRVGIVVHHATMRKRLRDTLLFSPFRSGHHIIDPRREWREVVDDICSCEFVFCQSLHGAIMAQCYGVPWVWWQGFHGRFATFKWGDWFASLGAEPESFRLGQLEKARRSAEARRAVTPDADALAEALTSYAERAEAA